MGVDRVDVLEPWGASMEESYPDDAVLGRVTLEIGPEDGEVLTPSTVDVALRYSEPYHDRVTLMPDCSPPGVWNWSAAELSFEVPPEAAVSEELFLAGLTQDKESGDPQLGAWALRYTLSSEEETNLVVVYHAPDWEGFDQISEAAHGPTWWVAYRRDCERGEVLIGEGPAHWTP